MQHVPDLHHPPIPPDEIRVAVHLDREAEEVRIMALGAHLAELEGESTKMSKVANLRMYR